eukprot:920355-Karenia_brevis.AAC.1
MDDLSARLQAGFTATMSKATTELNCLVSESVADSIHTLQARVETRCAETDARVAALNTKVDTTTAELRSTVQAQQQVLDHLLRESKESRQRHDEAEKAQARVAQQVQQDVDHRLVEDPSYPRPSNRTIVRLGTQPSTPLASVRTTCKAWLDPLFAEGSWQ